jgi:hypothetical protein
VIERLTEVAYFGAASFSSGQRKNALGFAATYTEIYACISAGLQALGADCVAVLWECNAGAHFGQTYKCQKGESWHDMWKNVHTATLGTAAIAVWFAVVTLGFGVHLWPLLEGVR